MKRDDFDIVNFLFLDGDVIRHPSYRIYIYQLIRFARAPLPVNEFTSHNEFFLFVIHFNQDYRCHNSEFYRRHFELITNIMSVCTKYQNPKSSSFREISDGKKFTDTQTNIVTKRQKLYTPIYFVCRGYKEYPYKRQFYYLNVGCKGVLIIRTCYFDAYLK